MWDARGTTLILVVRRVNKHPAGAGAAGPCRARLRGRRSRPAAFISQGRRTGGHSVGHSTFWNAVPGAHFLNVSFFPQNLDGTGPKTTGNFPSGPNPTTGTARGRSRGRSVSALGGPEKHSTSGPPTVVSSFICGTGFSSMSSTDGQ